MRAGHLDIYLETGAQWSRVVEIVEPDTQVPAGSVLPGQRIYVDGLPLLVYSVVPASSTKVTITFGRGLYSDPTLTVATDALVMLAGAVVVLESAAAYTIEDPTDPTKTETVTIPSTVAPDGLSLTIEIPAAATALMSEGSHSWDCYARTVSWDWQRILEGTLTVIWGDAR